MTDQPVTNIVDAIINLIETDKKLALFELQFCDTTEKCIEWKRKYLGKDSVVNQVLRGMNDKPVSGKFEEV